MLKIRHTTARNLLADLLAAVIVRNKLREAGLRARGPRFTRQRRVGRLQFAREDLNWNIQEWSDILFTDESRLCL